MARVLVVDDAIFMRATIGRLLEEKGHSMVGEASTGIEAIDKFVEVKPDVVILDITMPEMDGIDALKQIKEIDPNAKVIICSAIGQKDKVVEAIEHGALSFIVKPFTPEYLVEAVEQAVGKTV